MQKAQRLTTACCNLLIELGITKYMGTTLISNGICFVPTAPVCYVNITLDVVRLHFGEMVIQNNGPFSSPLFWLGMVLL